ncbi:MAG: LacI family DNA-binding transcriptional regulator [Puia sp.]|nr:LacI family DNA-binding transcriptional regulator [Puia sp.]
MNYKVTIADIAKELNITPATVSRALSNHPAISEKTKKSVLQTAKKLNYKRNRIASSLRSGKSHVIGVLIPSAEISFFGSIVHGIESMANLNGYTVLIYQSNETRDFEVKGIETFLGARVDGILASISKETRDYSHFIDIRDRGIPLVFFDRVKEELGIPSVVVDDYEGAYAATTHLICQGYTRVAHIAGQDHIKIFSDRLKGYRAALEAHNIPFDETLVYQQGRVPIESGREATRHFLAMKKPPDAIFAVDDFTALGVIKQLKEENIEIPLDFGIVGFGNEMFGEHISPGLSTVDQQTVLMGKESFTLLMDLIQSKEGEEIKRDKITLAPHPIFRNSSKRNLDAG